MNLQPRMMDTLLQLLPLFQISNTTRWFWMWDIANRFYKLCNFEYHSRHSIRLRMQHWNRHSNGNISSAVPGTLATALILLITDCCTCKWPHFSWNVATVVLWELAYVQGRGLLLPCGIWQQEILRWYCFKVVWMRGQTMSQNHTKLGR